MIESSYFKDNDTNLQDLLANVQHANDLVKGLDINPMYKKYENIELYEES